MGVGSPSMDAAPNAGILDFSYDLGKAVPMADRSVAARIYDIDCHLVGIEEALQHRYRRTGVHRVTGGIV